MIRLSRYQINAAALRIKIKINYTYFQQNYLHSILCGVTEIRLKCVVIVTQ